MKGICSVGMAVVYILLAVMLAGCGQSKSETIYAKHIKEANSLCERNNGVAYISAFPLWYEVACNNGAYFSNIQK